MYEGWSLYYFYLFFFSSRRRHTRCALVTGVQTCALPICAVAARRVSGITKNPSDRVRSEVAVGRNVERQTHQVLGDARELLVARVGGLARAKAQMQLLKDPRGLEHRQQAVDGKHRHIDTGYLDVGTEDPQPGHEARK